MAHTSSHTSLFSRWSNQTLIEYAVGFSLACVGAFLLTSDERFVLFLGICCSVLIACRYPIVTVTAHFIVFILPSVLMKCFANETTWKIFLQGINIYDILLGVMFMAVIIRTVSTFFNTLLDKKETSLQGDFKLGLCIAGLCIWFLYEIIRNLGEYGISAPGEFRSHYFILIVPVYIAVFFDSPDKRKMLCKATIFFCLMLPILCIPIIGEVKGWSIGEKSRFFPAGISFGILQGLLFSFLCNKYGYIKIPPFLQWLISLFAVLVIIFDTHRSVWFSFIIMSFVYLCLSQMNIKQSLNKITGYLLLIIAVFVLASSAVTSFLDKDLVEFVADRGGDLFIVDESYESSWTWRINRWKMEMDKITDSPITGIGFGGYWGDSDFRDSSGIFPHNLYVQILVKLGIVGLSLYLLIVGRVLQKIYFGIGALKADNDPEIVLLVAGMIALIGGHAYYLAYSFDEYSLFFVGLSMAVLRTRIGGHIR